MLENIKLEFDDVLNKQRKVFYEYRNKILELAQEKNLLKEVESIIQNNIQEFIQLPIDNIEPVLKELNILEEGVNLKEISMNDLYNFLLEKTMLAFEKTKSSLGVELLENVSKSMMLNILDNLWTNHLENLEYIYGKQSN